MEEKKETAYFNTLEYKKALSLMGKDPMEAKRRYETYIRKYPDDYSAYLNYASILIKIRETEAASKILNYVEKQYKSNDNFLKEKEKVEYVDQNLIIQRLRILAYEERYEEFYNLYLKNKRMLKSQDVDVAVFYVMKKLGKIKKEDGEIGQYHYIYNQIVDYSEDEFRQHIKYHLFDDTDDNERNKSMFVSGFEIDKVLEEIKKYIPSDKGIYNGFYQDTYVFKYDFSGRDNNKATDYFKVICFHNTSDIITICPSLYCENLPYVDLNYMEKEKPKQKTLSQIDKFNQRYRRK